MLDHAFQADVIDRLARIETKQDTTNGRVTTLEQNMEQLKENQSERRGAGRVAMGLAGLFGAGASEAIKFFFRR